MNPWRKPYLIPLFFVLALFVLGGVVMLLWNALIPMITGWSAITYMQAIALLALCRILFGGLRTSCAGGGWKNRHRSSPPWADPQKDLSDEERARLKAEWKRRCGPGDHC